MTSKTEDQAYIGTTRFIAEREEYGRESWPISATDREAALARLRTLSDESRFADPRIDHVRRHTVRRSGRRKEIPSTM